MSDKTVLVYRKACILLSTEVVMFQIVHSDDKTASRQWTEKGKSRQTFDLQGIMHMLCT